MKKFALSGIVTALALAASPAAHATVFPIDGPGNTATSFFKTNFATPGYTAVSASFQNVVQNAFSDTYTFTLPVSGQGSGSLSTTFVGKFIGAVINSVVITTKTSTKVYTGADFTTTATGQSLVSGIIDITGDPLFLNSIVVSGTTKNGLPGTYNGTLSFAAAVPEASTWAFMILGVGAVGFAARRSRKTSVRVTYA